MPSFTVVNYFAAVALYTVAAGFVVLGVAPDNENARFTNTFARRVGFASGLCAAVATALASLLLVAAH